VKRFLGLGRCESCGKMRRGPNSRKPNPSGGKRNGGQADKAMRLGRPTITARLLESLRKRLFAVYSPAASPRCLQPLAIARRFLVKRYLIYSFLDNVAGLSVFLHVWNRIYTSSWLLPSGIKKFEWIVRYLREELFSTYPWMETYLNPTYLKLTKLSRA